MDKEFALRAGLFPPVYGFSWLRLPRVAMLVSYLERVTGLSFLTELNEPDGDYPKFFQGGDGGTFLETYVVETKRKKHWALMCYLVDGKPKWILEGNYHERPQYHFVLWPESNAVHRAVLERVLSTKRVHLAAIIKQIPVHKLPRSWNPTMTNEAQEARIAM
jgi:hypothetical protein